MAFTKTTEWDVRSTGSDNNGGGFDTSSSGTDYSTQDAAQVTYTDLVIDAATNTKCTSAGNPFTSAHVGNVINITSGTGFTVQRVQVVSVAGSTATCDKSLGTLGSTGGHGNLGGGLATFATALTLRIDGNVVHIKNGTYTQTSTQTFGSQAGRFAGYNSAHNDAPTGTNRPLITTATNSTDLIHLNNNGSNGSVLFFDSIRFSNTAGTSAEGVKWSNSAMLTYFSNCKFSGFTIAVDNSSVDGKLLMDDCEVTACTGSQAVQVGDCAIFRHCWIHDNSGGEGVHYSRNNDNAVLIFDRTIVSGNNSYGVNITVQPGVLVLSNSIFYNNGNDGFHDSSGSSWDLQTDMYNHGIAVSINSNIFYLNTHYGVSINGVANGYISANRNNGYGANTTAARNNLPAGTNDVTLTGNPFNNAGSGDFSLNNTAGAGAACRAAGYPASFGAGLSTSSYPDIGAAQHQDPASGATVIAVNRTVILTDEASY